MLTLALKGYLSVGGAKVFSEKSVFFLLVGGLLCIKILLLVPNGVKVVEGRRKSIYRRVPLMRRSTFLIDWTLHTAGSKQ